VGSAHGNAVEAIGTRSVINVSGEQREVVAFLSDAATYEPAPENVTRIDTHGAHVFLADRDVLKIKRAVQYPYMDFSTLGKRRAACAREVEINAAGAPSIYKGLVAITREADGRLALDGHGTPIEWAVHMTRFCEDDVLSNRVARAPLTAGEAKALADAVVAAHARATPVLRPMAFDRISHDVLSALRAHFGGDDGETVALLTEQLERRLGHVTGLLVQRARMGHVRRCHGDLHLGNIVLIEGQPTLFDAIEFDEAMATIDVFYDLAFLLMDLDHHGQRAAANVVLNRYLWRRQEPSDLEALAALPLCLSLRAAIRAMVGAQKAALTGQGLVDARGYLVRAGQYLDDRRPELVLIGGLSGSGKSTLAALMAPSIGRAPGAVHLRSDLERKALCGAEELDRLPADAYSPAMTARVYAVMLGKCEAALRAGHSVVADAVHAHAAERGAMVALGHRTRARITGFWLDAPKNVLISRVAQRRNDASDATPQVVEQQLAYDVGDLEWTRIDASGTPEETLRTAMSHLHASIEPR
jgi:aminoglycoside phosphotransferase family enzyme/predicted kinase